MCTIFLFTKGNEQAAVIGYDNFESAYLALKNHKPTWDILAALTWEQIDTPSIIFREITE